MEATTAMENLGTAITSVWDYAQSAIEFIIGQPILLIGVAIFCVGAGIGLVKRVLG